MSLLTSTPLPVVIMFNSHKRIYMGLLDFKLFREWQFISRLLSDGLTHFVAIQYINEDDIYSGDVTVFCGSCGTRRILLFSFYLLRSLPLTVVIIMFD